MSITDRPGTNEPGGDVPAGGSEQPGRGAEEGGIGERVGRDPSNLGDEVGGAADITHPTPEPGVQQI